VTSMHFIGLDIHKKTISYCVKDVSGKVLSEGTVLATRIHLDQWMKTLPAPWTVAMEATMFTGWIYDHLLPHAAAVKVAHPLMLRAIAGRQEEERPHRCKQDLRLLAMRLPARVPHGFH
jgi:transposase